MTNIVAVTQALPEANQYVLAHLIESNTPWIDCDDPEGNRFWVVVKFKVGISIDERLKLPKDDTRRYYYKAEDEHGNNQRPYCWSAFGPSSYFGQDVDYWLALPSTSTIGEMTLEESLELMRKQVAHQTELAETYKQDQAFSTAYACERAASVINKLILKITR